ncbi:hypothetical protein F3109_06565 [Klebsiella quasipneumoniae]|uniref:hypothetical protein n=1 Tax=Klebsiella quasipneumoniae TaxID=1463165 RepID=UPI00160CF2BF|nr:hypothetical protein [Klebsiella quasipneumoniae]QNC83189.1 hypothetical protein F3109_06565 [Klebsiella quasipneumoniae]
MNIKTVNELIASLESAGELSIRETKVMAMAKAFKQLAQLEEQVKAEHACKNGIHLFDKAGQRKLDALSWAVYNKQKAERAA